MAYANGDATDYENALSRLRPFSELSSDTLAEMAAISTLRRYRAGQVVVHDGDRSEFIGCVREGFLRMQKTLVDGRQHIVGLLVEGDMFGQVFNGPLHFAIEASTDAEVWAFQRAPFEALLLRAPDLERVVLLNILNELDRARDWMVIVSGQRVTGRLAGFLLVMCTTFAEIDHILVQTGKGPEIRIPISRIDLAHLLGTRPESISRAFHALQDDGDIEIIGPDHVRLLNLDGLAEKAGEDGSASNANLRELLQVLEARK